MESVLWAINLLAVVYLCFWALKQDSLPEEPPPAPVPPVLTKGKK